MLFAVGRFICDPEVERRALGETEDELRSAVAGICRLAGEALGTWGKKGSHSFWRCRTHLIVPIAVGVAAAVISSIVLSSLSNVKGIGWDFDPCAPGFDVWQQATRTIDFYAPFNYPTQLLVIGATPQITDLTKNAVEKVVNDNTLFRSGESLVVGVISGGVICVYERFRRKRRIVQDRGESRDSRMSL